MARRFFDDTSSAKTFTKGYLIAKALTPKLIQERICAYELRQYDMKTGKYERIGKYYSRETAKVGKAFYEIEHGLTGVAIVAVNLTPSEYLRYKCRSASIYGMACEGGD